jgi:hypothetical protein
VILAAAKSEFEIILYIAAAVWGVISWVRQKKAESDTPVEPGPPRQSPAPRPIQQGESEQERMRRFLEALGVPQGQQPSPPIIPAPVQRPKPSPVQQRPAPQQRPIPRPQTTQTVRRPAPKPVFVEPEEMQLAGRLEEPATAIEGIGTSFDAMASGIVIPAMELPAESREVTARTVVDGAQHTSPTAVSSKAIHAMLRSPDSLRTALVIREILGPPRGEAI